MKLDPGRATFGRLTSRLGRVSMGLSSAHYLSGEQSDSQATQWIGRPSKVSPLESDSDLQIRRSVERNSEPF